MAELEVAKHTKKVYKIWNSKEHGFWHKFKEFFIEILIITFAVSLSIWFHNMSEHSHDKKEATAFLIGLKSDLMKDMEEMKFDSLSFEEQRSFFKYLTDSVANIDSAMLRQRMYLFTNRTVLLPNVSRFEALKYSGKMRIIDNAELLDEILNLYEEKIPFVVNEASSWFTNKEKTLISLLDSNRLLARSRLSELRTFISSNEDFKYSLKRTNAGIQYILSSYHDVISQHEKIIQLIDLELQH